MREVVNQITDEPTDVVSRYVPRQASEWLWCGVVHVPTGPPRCPHRKSNLDAVMMESSEQWDRLDRADR
jgi:hypothetical protein